MIGQIVPSSESRTHPEPTTEQAVRLRKLIGELLSDLYYAATILEFFHNSADENRWRTAVVPTDVPTHLAKAREAFATSTRGIGVHLEVPQSLGYADQPLPQR